LNQYLEFSLIGFTATSDWSLFERATLAREDQQVFAPASRYTVVEGGIPDRTCNLRLHPAALMSS